MHLCCFWTLWSHSGRCYQTTWWGSLNSLQQCWYQYFWITWTKIFGNEYLDCAILCGSNWTTIAWYRWTFCGWNFCSCLSNNVISYKYLGWHNLYGFCKRPVSYTRIRMRIILSGFLTISYFELIHSNARFVLETSSNLFSLSSFFRRQVWEYKRKKRRAIEWSGSLYLWALWWRCLFFSLKNWAQYFKWQCLLVA